MNKLKMITVIFLIMSFVFTPLYNSVYATSEQNTSGNSISENTTKKMQEDIRNWLNGSEKKIKKYTYNNDNGMETNTYTIIMPKPNSKYNVGFNPDRRKLLL